MSALSPRAEYLAFFEKHGIHNPDVVAIGFMGDASSTLASMGFPRPATFSDESLRALWYPNINGRKALLVSINGNRIFASRAGDLMNAIFDNAPYSRPVVVFLGSAGAIDAPDWIGKIAAPTTIMNGDPFPNAQSQRGLVHLVRNRGVDFVALQSLHASVESVVVETTEWAKQMKRRRVKTVDQELYHVIDAIHSSTRGAETEIYAGVMVTDHIAAELADNELTLEIAEDTIDDTAKVRHGFFSNVFRSLLMAGTKLPYPPTQREYRKSGSLDR